MTDIALARISRIDKGNQVPKGFEYRGERFMRPLAVCLSYIISIPLAESDSLGVGNAHENHRHLVAELPHSFRERDWRALILLLMYTVAPQSERNMLGAGIKSGRTGLVATDASHLRSKHDMQCPAPFNMSAHCSHGQCGFLRLISHAQPHTHCRRHLAHTYLLSRMACWT